VLILSLLIIDLDQIIAYFGGCLFDLLKEELTLKLVVVKAIFLDAEMILLRTLALKEQLLGFRADLSKSYLFKWQGQYNYDIPVEYAEEVPHEHRLFRTSLAEVNAGDA
jgi:hypothetical protein